MNSMETVSPDGDLPLNVRVRRERRRRKMTQAQAADAAGIGLRTYQMFEHGDGQTQAGNVAAILEVIPVDDAPHAPPTPPTHRPSDDTILTDWLLSLPGDVRTFLMTMGAFLMTKPDRERLEFIFEETRRIVSAADTRTTAVRIAQEARDNVQNRQVSDDASDAELNRLASDARRAGGSA